MYMYFDLEPILTRSTCLMIILLLITLVLVINPSAQTINHVTSGRNITIYNASLHLNDAHFNQMHRNSSSYKIINQSIRLLNNDTTYLIEIFNYTSRNSPGIRFSQVNESPTWTGYIVAKNFSSPRPQITGIRGSWVIQNTTETMNMRGSAQWIGIGGVLSAPFNDSSLIQVGTASFSGENGTAYFAWYELLPLPPEIITYPAINIPLPVQPADKVYSSIIQVGDTYNIPLYRISINDTTQGWNYSFVTAYPSSRLSAEFIEERPRIPFFGNFGLPDFSLSYYGKDFTGLDKTDSVDINNSTFELGAQQNREIVMIYNATPDPITPDGTSFGVTYGNLSVHALTNKTIARFGDKISINAAVSGGMGPFTYQWYTANRSFGLNPLHFKSATSNTLRATVTGNTIYVVYVTDTGAPQPYPVAYDYVIVNTTPANSTSPNNLYPPIISPTSPKIDVGQSILLHATESIIPKGGSLLWQWYTVKNNTVTKIPGATNTIFNVSNIVSNTSYEVSVASTVGSGNAVFSAPENVIVYPAFSTPSIMPISPTITRGQSIILNALETGGTGTFAYQWYTVLNNSVVTPINGAINSTLTVSPNSTTTYQVQVTDTGTNTYAIPLQTEMSTPVTVTVISVGFCGTSSHVNISVTAPPGISVVPGFQQLLLLNTSRFPNASPNFQNARFFYSNCSTVTSWLESTNSTRTVYWLKLVNGIPAGKTLNITIGFVNKTESLFNGTTIGEAPQLSPSYGQYDNGAQIFNFYDNFAGTTLKGWWYYIVYGDATLTVDDGLALYSGTGNTTSSHVGPFVQLCTSRILSCDASNNASTGSRVFNPQTTTLEFLAHTSNPDAITSTLIGWIAQNYPNPYAYSIFYMAEGFFGIAYNTLFGRTVFVSLTGESVVLNQILSIIDNQIAGVNYAYTTISPSPLSLPTSGIILQNANFGPPGYGATSTLYVQWIRVRDSLPNNEMPSVAIDGPNGSGSEYPGNASVADTSIILNSSVTNSFIVGNVITPFLILSIPNTTSNGIYNVNKTT